MKQSVVVNLCGVGVLGVAMVEKRVFAKDNIGLD